MIELVKRAAGFLKDGLAKTSWDLYIFEYIGNDEVA
jgi:hypothetical protein